MVLARVANFFTNGESTQDLVEEGRRDVAVAMDSVASSAANTAEVIAEEIEDEGRPPYLHVRKPRVRDRRTSIDTRAGNVGWRLRRFDWRYAHALLGYGQDTATRRPTHATEVHIHGQHVLYNLATRRIRERSLRRCQACFSGILLWNSVFLWDIRVQQTFHDRQWRCAVSGILHSRSVTSEFLANTVN